MVLDLCRLPKSFVSILFEAIHNLQVVWVQPSYITAELTQFSRRKLLIIAHENFNMCVCPGLAISYCRCAEPCTTSNSLSLKFLRQVWQFTILKFIRKSGNSLPWHVYEKLAIHYLEIWVKVGNSLLNSLSHSPPPPLQCRKKPCLSPQNVNASSATQACL